MNRGVRLVIVGVTAILAWSGCHHDGLDTLAPRSQKTHGPGNQISSSNFEYEAAWDTYWQNISSSGTGLCSSSEDIWRKEESCSLLKLFRWSGMIARSYLAIDFDLCDIPETAVVDSAWIQVYLNDTAYRDSLSTEPENLICESGPPSGMNTEYHDAPYIGVYYGTVDHAGVFADSVRYVITDACGGEYCSSGSEVYTECQVQVTLPNPGAEHWATIGIAHSEWIAGNAVSRFGIDLEAVQGPVATYFEFCSVDGNSHRPKLIIQYHVPPYHPCLDGQINHNTTVCTGADTCAAGQFSINTTGTISYVGRDGVYTGVCGVHQMVLMFDTSDLADGHALTGATLEFTSEKEVEAGDVDTRRIEVYSKTEPDSCGITAGDFVGCADGFTSLGTVSMTNDGAKVFSIPSPNTHINKTGITKFVLVDDSTFSGPDAYILFRIRTDNHATEVHRPRLTVSY